MGVILGEEGLVRSVAQSESAVAAVSSSPLHNKTNQRYVILYVMLALLSSIDIPVLLNSV